MKHTVPIKANIHNRFDIEVRDAVTGRIKSRAYAENIILNKLWTNICSNNAGYFRYISIGTGSGTLDATRTSLFTHLVSKQLTDSPIFEMDEDGKYVSCRRSAQLLESDNVGAIITEIGVAYDITATGLVTHAMLKDMNGNPTSIEKKDVDIITFYATLYFTFPDLIGSLPSYLGGRLHIVALGSSGVPYYSATLDRRMNWLLFKIFGLGNNQPVGYYGFFASRYSAANKTLFVADSNIDEITDYVVGDTAYFAATQVNSAVNKTITFTGRLPAASKNDGHGIRSVELVFHRFDSPYDSLLRGLVLRFPNTSFDGTNISGEQVGVGDGVQTKFQTLFPFVRSGAVVKVDGTPVSSGVTVITALPKSNSALDILRPLTESHGATNTSYDFISFALRSSPGESFGYPYGPAMFENEYNTTVGISSIHTYTGQRIYVSDDAIGWALIKEGAEGQFSVPAEYRRKRYWKFMGSSDIGGTGAAYNFVNDITDFDNIVFDNPPAAGAVITVDYTTDVVAKDANHVFDLSIELQFGEYTP